MNLRIESLRLVELACWQQLERAAAEPDHAWRTLVLATTDGHLAHARMVVLREVDAGARTLRFYTDARAAKVAQLGAHPRGTLLAWSAALGWQLRLRCRFEVDHGGLAASSRWARLRLTPAAQDYLSPLAPGSEIGTHQAGPAPREHFAVVSACVEAIDWLELHAEGHRRALFDAQGPRWVQP
jgi:hypothetical protein